jgi:hypothetical protein
MSRGEAFEHLIHRLAQGVTPLLQTQEEALDTSPLFQTRLMLQDVFDTGALDIGIAYPAYGAWKTP